MSEAGKRKVTRARPRPPRLKLRGSSARDVRRADGSVDDFVTVTELDAYWSPAGIIVEASRKTNGVPETSAGVVLTVDEAQRLVAALRKCIEYRPP